MTDGGGRSCFAKSIFANLQDYRGRSALFALKAVAGSPPFTIGIVISPLDGLSLGLCQRIAAAISALSSGEGERRAELEKTQ